MVMTIESIFDTFRDFKAQVTIHTNPNPAVVETFLIAADLYTIADIWDSWSGEVGRLLEFCE
jgi:hypothetical protein